MIEPGVYRHKKGNMYRVLFVATDANNEARHKGGRQVVYLSMANGNIYVRDEAEFSDVDDKGVHRFMYIGESIE